ncbi:unnamed protein product [Onchocerca flexuosa]|uniref:Uncharacterized protein n=1 Tax=Onchocerca flexuosa TaxID=387005 RepID=A0A183I803_9BILA|nr:unnamed protein product [Onchocerca flexuosa]
MGECLPRMSLHSREIVLVDEEIALGQSTGSLHSRNSRDASLLRVARIASVSCPSERISSLVVVTSQSSRYGGSRIVGTGRRNQSIVPPNTTTGMGNDNDDDLE